MVRNLFRRFSEKPQQSTPKPVQQIAYIQNSTSAPIEPRPVKQTAYIQGASTSSGQTLNTSQTNGQKEGSRTPVTPKAFIRKDDENESEDKFAPRKVDASANSLRVLSDFVNRTAEKGVDGLKKEYSKLDKYFDTTATFDAFRMNMPKNRYSDVLCPDETRVKLWYGEPEFTEYIHGNRINDAVLPTNYFICTQGPTNDTVHDFWRMIFQERIRNIIMLCNPVEDGKIKCATYWPDQETGISELPTLIVKNQGTDEDEFTITRLSVEPNPNYVGNQQLNEAQSAPLEVTLLRWIGWPDRGIPSKQCQTILPLILLDKVRGLPTVIHCSAGIGRTGCLMALEVAHERISRGKKVDFDQLRSLQKNCKTAVHKSDQTTTIVRDIRCYRAQIIQTEIQYLYINRVIIEYAYMHANLDDSAYEAGKKFIDEYERKLRK